MEWLYDQIEVVVAVILAAIAGIGTIFTTAFNLGSKITKLDEHTTSGLEKASLAIDHVSEKVDTLADSIKEVRQESKAQHDTLIEHSLKIAHLDTKFNSIKGIDL